MRRILFPAPITLDLLEYEREVWIDEILKRTTLMFGGIDPEVNAFGIVDKQDPSSALTSDTRPFAVSINPTDPATVDVQGGTAVFQSGEVIVLDATSTRLSVPGGIGTKSIVYLYFSELETRPKLTRYETLANTQVTFLASPADYIRITTRSDYDALTADERAKTIPLALITVQEVVASGGGTTTTLVIDMTRSTLTVNRPWFSAADVQHRSYLGTGVKTENNPHALSLNDLAATSGFTLFQLHLDHGVIVSKDQSLSKLPGKVCVEEILSGAITQDVTGDVTGIRDAWYFRTSKFPTLVLRATDSELGADLAPVQIPRKNIIFFLPTDEYAAGRDVTVVYMTADAAEPPTTSPLTSLTFGQPNDREAIIAGGVSLSTITNPELTFEDAGPVPQRYIVYLNKDGLMERYPQTIYCYKRLTDIGSSLRTFDTTMKGLARLKLALSQAVAGPGLLVRVQITGKDSGGSTIVETVEFNSSWVDTAVGTCSENPLQFVYTTNYFASVTNFIVTDNVSSGPDAALMILADVNPTDTEEIADLLPVAEVVWDGLQVCDLEDIRPINTTMHLPKITKYAAAGLASAEGTLVYRPGYLYNFWVEDFDQPRFISTEVVDTDLARGLAPTKTKMRKIFEGLDRFDTYVGKPIAVLPHLSAPQALRFIPIEPDRDFNMLARYFDGTGNWSNWVPLGGFMLPAFTIDLVPATSPLVKWQVVVSGQCKGLIVVYVTDGPGVDPGSVVFDVGTWDNGTFT
jgi:hypothetical protein